MNQSNEETQAGKKIIINPPLNLAGKQFGDYRIINEIGHGGMAVVYSAEQISLNRPVAIKIIPHTLVEEPDYLERFKREATAAANLNHPNIVSIHGFGQFEDIYYYVMDLANGKTLDKIIEEKKQSLLKRARQFSIDSALNIIEQAANALSYSHKQGIVHRDIKPGNLFIDEEAGRLVITDFGLAKSKRWEKITPKASLFGTPAYMSPEQAQGKDIDHRTDIYSLGAVLYELVSGTEPYTGENALEVIEKVKMEPLIPPRQHNPDIPPKLESIILKAMSKDIWLRYQGMEEFLKDIQRFQQGGKITTFTHIAEKKFKERKILDTRLLYFILTMIIAVGIIVGIAMYFRR